MNATVRFEELNPIGCWRVIRGYMDGDEFLALYVIHGYLVLEGQVIT